jgi:outer membrane autotransporter protein
MGLIRIRSHKHWRVLGISLMLKVCLATGASWAADLVIDGGTTYTINSDISFDKEYVGTVSSGTLNQNGFTNTLSAQLYLGYSPGSSGTYNLSGGSLINKGITIGNEGTGTFNQGGGTNTTNANLVLGYLAGSKGTYNLSGGISTVAGIVFLGYNSGSSGTYNLSGGGLSAGFGFVGYNGLGVFQQSSGTTSISNNLQLGFSAGSSGTYNLSGGSLMASTLYVGKTGNGIFNQSGGSNTIEHKNSISAVYVGYYPGSSGTYNLNGGCLSAPAEYIGALRGPGIFNQSGGSNQVAGVLALGDLSGSSGTYNLSSGSLSTIATIIGNLGIGTFNQTGGSHTVSDTLALTARSGGSGTYNLQEGSLSAVTISLEPGGTFNQTGGSLNAITFNQQGGTVEGALQNRGTFNYGSGTFSGRLLNYGVVNFTADFTAANGLTNYSALGIDKGRIVTLNGQGLDNRGSIIVDGTMIGGGPLLNNSTGFLRGSGTAQGVLTNQGTVSPGNSVGALNLVGSYTQTAGGILRATIASATSYSQLKISGIPGTASLGGTMTPILLNGYLPQAGQVFSGVVTATGGISGAFSAVSNFTPTLMAQPLYAADHVDLLAQRNYTNSFLGPLTRNQYVVGAMLNGLAGTATGDLNTVLNSLDGIPTSTGVQNAYKQISPEKTSALATIAFTGATFQMRNLAQRITDLRFGRRAAGDVGSQPGAFGFNYSRGEGLMLAYNSSSLAGLLTSTRPPAPENRWGLYLDPSLILGAQQSSVNQTGFTFTMAGFSAGADYRVRDHLLMGLATGYSHTDASFHGSGGGVQTNTWPLTAYVAYLPQSWYAYGSLGYALNLFNLQRQLGFNGLNRTATSSPAGNQFNAYGEAGYDLKFRPLVVTPVVSLAYSGIWVDNYTESGAGALNLKVAAQNATSLQTGVGAKVAAPLRRGPVTVVPQAYATYQHEFANDSRGLNASLSQGGSTFNFQTDAAGRNYTSVGANVNILTDKNFQVQLDYNAEVGRSNYTAHSVYGGVRWEF